MRSKQALALTFSLLPTTYYERMLPNPSIERTRNGRPSLAFISFWAKRVLPVPAAHVKR